MEQGILLIGFGNMGQALVKGWLGKGAAPRTIRVVDPEPKSREAAESLGLCAGASAADALRGDDSPPDVVVLAVKPAQVDAALRPLAPLADRGTLFLSIAAGRTIGSLAAAVGGAAAIVRAMPNTPAAIGRGITVMTASERVGGSQRRAAADLMSAVGEVEWLDDERLMDAVTAVSGSGPAYVFLLIECMTMAGVAAGLDEALATKLATATVAGAGAYAVAAGDPAAELRRRVTSPGGTTEAALRVLTAGDAIGKLFEDAIHAAADRSRELSAG